MNPESSLKLQTLEQFPVLMTKEKVPKRWALPRTPSRHWCGRDCSSRSAIRGVIA